MRYIGILVFLCLVAFTQRYTCCEASAACRICPPKRSATLNPGLAHHTHHRLLDRMHLVPTTMRNHVLYYMMSANLDRNRLVTPRTSLLRLVALVPIRLHRFNHDAVQGVMLLAENKRVTITI